MKLPAEKRERIKKAALEEFSRGGYDRASTVEISKQAGISKGALFHYFGNKKKLFQFLLEDTLQELRRVLLEQRPDEPKDFFDYLYEMGRIKIEFAREHPFSQDFLLRFFQSGELEQEKGFELKEMMEEQVRLMAKRVDPRCFRDGIALADAMKICTYVSEGVVREYEKQHRSLDVEEVMKEWEQLTKRLKIMLYREMR